MNAAVLLSQFVRGGIMSKFERLLEAGSTELPDCRCTAEMHPIAIVPVPGGISEIRIFRCPKCGHEQSRLSFQEQGSGCSSGLFEAI